MAKARAGEGLISTFLLVVSLFGAVGGAIVGYGLDGIVQQKRLLALIAGCVAVALVSVFRAILGKSFPSLFLARPVGRIPLPVWVSVGYSTLIGGLAGHDLAEMFDVPSGAVLGLISGCLAAVSMATLMIIYLRQHPEKGVEF